MAESQPHDITAVGLLGEGEFFPGAQPWVHEALGILKQDVRVSKN